MRIGSWGAAAAAAGLVIFFFAGGARPEPAAGPGAPAPGEGPEGDRLARGAYLVRTLGCADCHSPKVFTPAGPQPDLERFMSGFPAAQNLPSTPKDLIGPDRWGGLFTNDLTAWVGPWGTSFAINLTPDEDTGIGTWSEGMFVKALRTGKHFGEGRPILPPMPWPCYANMTDEDLEAIFAHLKTLKPIHNPVPDPIPPAAAPGAPGAPASE